MAANNASIQILRSYANTTPNNLLDGQLAYSFVSNTLFIGSNTANGNVSIEIGGKSVLETINTIFGVVNSVIVIANSAYDQANVATTRSNSAYNQANTATRDANNALTIANSGYAQANVATRDANNALTIANSAYRQANIATTIANSAYDQANTATANANIAFITANAAYRQANIATINADAAFAFANNIIAGNVAFSNVLITTGGSVFFGSNTWAQSNRASLYVTNEDWIAGLDINNLLPGDFYYDVDTDSIFIYTDFGGGYYDFKDITVRA
jgi:hypothetical protein